MKKILTLIIPTYNMEEYLDKCLTSLIIPEESIMDKLEVLVVIDGAQDRSSEIAHGFQNRFPSTFRVIDKENGNYGSCINRGLKEATGKYIKILDADDSYDNRFFADYLSFLDKCDVDLIINDLVYVNTKGKDIKKSIFKLPKDRVFGFEEFSREMIELYAMHRAAYKTDNLRAINYYQTEGVSYTDQEWIFAPLTTVTTIRYFSYPLYRYLIGREGQTMDPKVLVRQINHHVIGAKKMISDYLEFKDLPMSQQLVINQRLQLRCSKIYFDYLSNPSLQLEELITFDHYIKEKSSVLYSMLNDSNLSWLIKYKYIRIWRQNGRKGYLKRNWLLLTRCSNILRSIKWRVFTTIN